MTREPIRVGFVLLSNSRNPVPSTRIAVLNMLPLLEAHGIRGEILYEPAVSDESPDLDAHLARMIDARCDLVVFQKVRGPGVIRAIRALREHGIPSLYSVCDLIEPEVVAETAATAAVTDYLRQLYPAELRAKISVVHDGIERPELFRDPRAPVKAPGARLAAVLVTSQNLQRVPILEIPPPGYDVTIVGRYPAVPTLAGDARDAWNAIRSARSSRDRLFALAAWTHPRLRRVAWTPDGAYEAMLSADVGIVPADYSQGVKPGQPGPGWMVKSENRLTMKMSLGLPVVASPIPSYEAVVVHGVNGFLARTRADWLGCMRQLRDPELRAAMGQAARASVAQRFSMQRQAELLASLIAKLVRGATPVASDHLRAGAVASATGTRRDRA